MRLILGSIMIAIITILMLLSATYCFSSITNIILKIKEKQRGIDTWVESVNAIVFLLMTLFCGSTIVKILYLILT